MLERPTDVEDFKTMNSSWLLVTRVCRGVFIGVGCCHVIYVKLFLLSAVLKLTAVDRGVVVIQGTEAGRYLAMSDEGRLYSSVSVYSRAEDPCDSKSVH